MLESLRLEKGYRYWSKDLTPDYNPFEAGLDFCVNLKKKVRCIGRDVLEEVHQDGPERTLCCFTLDKDVELLGGETIIHNDTVLGVLTSGGYGHTLQATIAYGYVPTEEAHHERYVIECLGEPIPATRHDDVLYDPERAKILC